MSHMSHMVALGRIPLRLMVAYSARLSQLKHFTSFEVKSLLTSILEAFLELFSFKMLL